MTITDGNHTYSESSGITVGGTSVLSNAPQPIEVLNLQTTATSSFPAGMNIK